VFARAGRQNAVPSRGLPSFEHGLFTGLQSTSGMRSIHPAKGGTPPRNPGFAPSRPAMKKCRPWAFFRAMEATRQGLPQITALLAQFGAVKSVTFKRVSPGGADIYVVTFEHGSMDWRLMMLSDEKIASIGARPL
jgi:hypothetical protein